jgi:3-dehydroquinate dehydratase-2
MKLYVLNGPNLNFLGIREPIHYGRMTYDMLCSMIYQHCDAKGIEVVCLQSNHEGELVDFIQEAYYKNADGIVINPGAYTHTSIALLDAVKSVSLPTVEVHISKVEEREDFRQISYIRAACQKTITGHGTNGYLEAIDFLIDFIKENEKQPSQEKGETD